MVNDTSTPRQSEGAAARLLQAADRLFYQQGYAATGVNELLKEAGIAKASFYKNFRSKNDLILAYLEHRQEAVFGDMVKVIDRHRSPERRVLALFDFLTEWLQANDFRGCAFLNTVPEFADASSPPRAAVRQAKEGMRSYVAELCSEAGRAEMSDEVFLLLEGATVQAAALTDLWPVKAARKAMQRRLKNP